MSATPQKAVYHYLSPAGDQGMPGAVNVTATGAASDILVNADVISGTGALTFNAGENITLNSGNLTTGGPVNLTAGKTISESAAGLITGTLLTTSSTTGTTLNNTNLVSGFHAVNTVSGNVSLTDSGPLNVTGIDETGGTINITDAGTITVSGNVTDSDATGSVTLRATGVSSDLHLISAVSSIGGSINLQAGHDVQIDASAPVTSSSGDIITVAGNAAAVSAMMSAGHDLQITAGTTINVTAPLLAGDAMTIQSTGSTTMTAASSIMAGLGGVTITAGQLITGANITTASGPVLIQGPVRLTDAVSIQTLVSGNISVNGAIDGSTTGQQDLTLTAGSGSINITGNIGAGTQLGDLIVTSANNAHFGGSLSASTFLQKQGSGVTTIVGPVNTVGTIAGTNDGFQFTGASLQFSPVSASLDTHGHDVTITADAITLPTTFTNAIGSTVTLQTLTPATSIGLNDASQTLNFTGTQLSTIHSTNVVIGSTTQTGGIIIGTDGAIHESQNYTLRTAATVLVNGLFALDSSHTLSARIGTDLVMAATGELETFEGKIDLDAAGKIFMADRAVINSGSGQIVLTANQDVPSWWNQQRWKFCRRKPDR